MCREFVKNIQTLSPAERVVFDLYVQGYKAKEIAEILCLSINTIKTHNRRIYMKLNVTSRKELMLYIQMIKEADIPLIM
jgi:DNA-binding CsgD family transcriptional regulator